MTGINTKTSRRAFFMQGGAALGAGVVTTAGAAAVMTDDALPLKEQLNKLQRQMHCAEDREAIRQLHRAFTTLIENQTYEAAVELFDEQAHLDLSGVSATGKPAILQMFADQYRHHKATVIHNAYRQSSLQPRDTVAPSDDRSQATATFPVEVELCTPLQEDCTAARMARLQGQMADRRWETGRLEANYVNTRGQWKMASLSYVPS